MFSHPARGYVSSKEGEETDEATDERSEKKRNGGEIAIESRQATTSSTNLDGTRVQLGSTGW